MWGNWKTSENNEHEPNPPPRHQALRWSNLSTKRSLMLTLCATWYFTASSSQGNLRAKSFSLNFNWRIWRVLLAPLTNLTHPKPSISETYPRIVSDPLPVKAAGHQHQVWRSSVRHDRCLRSPTQPPRTIGWSMSALSTNAGLFDQF